MNTNHICKPPFLNAYLFVLKKCDLRDKVFFQIFLVSLGKLYCVHLFIFTKKICISLIEMSVNNLQTDQ